MRSNSGHLYRGDSKRIAQRFSAWTSPVAVAHCATEGTQTVPTVDACWQLPDMVVLGVPSTSLATWFPGRTRIAAEKSYNGSRVAPSLLVWVHQMDVAIQNFRCGGWREGNWQSSGFTIHNHDDKWHTWLMKHLMKVFLEAGSVLWVVNLDHSVLGSQ
jgi:hypothetical protein